MQRRDLLINSLKIPAAYGILRFTSGCGASDTTEPPKPLQLVFREDDTFYKTLNEGISQRRAVLVDFDGEHKVGKDSKFLTYLKGAENGADFLIELKHHNTEQGRQKLARAFTKDLLRQEIAQKPVVVGDQTVVEPATVVIVLIFVVSACGVVAASKKFGVEIDMSAGPFRIHVKPMA